MAIVQKNLFSWQELDEAGDLERLDLVMRVLDDEKLMQKLEKERGKGRDDNPVRAMWNSVLAGIVYEHESAESLRRELKRNPDLLNKCGFDTTKGVEAVPLSSAYTRFLKKLLRHQEEIDEMLNKIVEELEKILPGFGSRLGIDSKAISSHAKRLSKKLKADGRRELDGDYGKKKYTGKREDGKLWEKVINWFGYKIFLIVDVDYELPIGYKVTKASKSDMKPMLPMVEEIQERQPKIIKKTGSMAGDRGFDSTENNRELWDKYKIKPVIDIRNMWKDGEETKLINEDKADNIVYDYRGNIFCINPETGDKLRMNFCGYEKGRNCLKYRCRAAACGVSCKGASKCGTGEYGEYGRIVRIPLEKDRRIFTPLARPSYAFKREYKKRTAVERVNSRLDVSFGFERHYIRGMKKMRLRCSLALVVMLAMALGRARQNQQEYIRSLVKMPKAA